MIKDVFIPENRCAIRREVRYSSSVMAEQSKQPQVAVAEAIHLLQTFRGADLTHTIYQIYKSLKGVSPQNYSAVLTTSVGFYGIRN